jgi:RNA polymerase sigma factor (sigma-70 family)
LTDAQLLAEYRRTGSRRAYSEIVSRYADAVYATCLRTLGDAHSAEDAAQAAFLVLLAKGRKLSPGTVLAGWLHRTARNCALNVKQAAARRARHEREAMAVRADRAENAADLQRARPELDAALDSLPAAQRHALALRYLRGLSRAEVAAELGCPERTAESRLRLGLEKLRARLSRRGAALSAAALAGLLGEEVSAPASLTASIQGLSLGTATASAAATATAEAIMKMMFWMKVKLCVGAALLAGAVGAGGVLGARAALGGDAPGLTAEPAPPPPPGPAGDAVPDTTADGKRIPPEKNAATYYLQAIATMPKYPSEAVNWFLNSSSTFLARPEVLLEQPGAAEFILAHRATVQLVRKGASQRDCDLQLDASAELRPAGPLARVRELSRRLRVWGMYQEARGKSGEEATLRAARAYLDIVRMGLHLGQQDEAADIEVVGWACSGIGLGALQDMMARGIGEKTSRAILEGLAELPARPFDMAGPMRFESKLRCEVDFTRLRRALAEGGDLDHAGLKALVGLDSYATLSAAEAARIRRVVAVLRAETDLVKVVDRWTAEYRAVAEKAAAACDGPFHLKHAEVAALAAEVERKVGHLHPSNPRTDDLAIPGTPAEVTVERLRALLGYNLLLTAMPRFGRLYASSTRCEAMLGGTRLLAAACLERARTGRFPDSLEGLGKHFPDGLPADPFTGEAFQYRIEKDLPTVECRGSSMLSGNRPTRLYTFSLSHLSDQQEHWTSWWRTEGKEDLLKHVSAPPPEPADIF